MAVDTRNRRASCLGFALAALVILPAPDATIDTADRAHVAMSYAGLSVGLPQTPALLVAYAMSTGPVAAHAQSSAAPEHAALSSPVLET